MSNGTIIYSEGYNAYINDGGPNPYDEKDALGRWQDWKAGGGDAAIDILYDRAERIAYWTGLSDKEVGELLLAASLFRRQPC